MYSVLSVPTPVIVKSVPGANSEVSLSIAKISSFLTDGGASTTSNPVFNRMVEGGNADFFFRDLGRSLDAVDGDLEPFRGSYASSSSSGEVSTDTAVVMVPLYEWIVLS